MVRTSVRLSLISSLIHPQSTRGYSQLRVGTKDNLLPSLLERLQYTIPKSLATNLHDVWTFLLGSRSKPVAWVELQRHIANCQEDDDSMTRPITEVIASKHQNHRWTRTPACETDTQMSSWKRGLSTAAIVARGRTAAQRQQLSDCHAQGLQMPTIPGCCCQGTDN